MKNEFCVLFHSVDSDVWATMRANPTVGVTTRRFPAALLSICSASCRRVLMLADGRT